MSIESVVVVGGGVGGWLAASLLARHLPHLRITVIDGGGADRSLGVATAAETLLPADLETMMHANWDEDALIRGACGSFMLGSALSGWRADGGAGFVPFGDIGAPMLPIAFHQLVARARSKGVPVNLANYSFAALCAQTGRFARPTPDDRSVRATLTYGLNVETGAAAQLFRGDAVARGVTVVVGTAVTAEKAADGTLNAVGTADGSRIAAELFIDASGAGGVLCGPTESWAAHFPFDRAATALRPTSDPPLPYVHVDANAGGWQSFTPVGGGVGETFLFAAAARSGEPEAACFAPGRQRRAWRGNVVAIGGAAAQLDPVSGTQLHLALADVSRLITLFPNDRACSAEAAEYNRQWGESTDCAFDFAMLRLARNGAAGATWDHVRSRPLPERLAYRVALYESCGRVVLHDGESFEESTWVAHFDALGIWPRRYQALAHALPVASIDAHFGRIRDVMLKAVAAMPPHAATLAQIAR